MPYFLFVLLIGSTGVIEEIALGRAAGTGPIGAFGKCTEIRYGKTFGQYIGCRRQQERSVLQSDIP